MRFGPLDHERLDLDRFHNLIIYLIKTVGSQMQLIWTVKFAACYLNEGKG